MQPKLNVDAEGNVTVSGDIDLAPKPTTSIFDAIGKLFK
jgi:hypothetical protein